jgi:hypothetical protein
MSYLCFRASKANEAEIFSFICSSIVSMGWVLHDDISSTHKVYKSNGELGDRIYEYIELTSSGYIYFRAWGYWNNSTHVGSCSAYPTGGAGQDRIQVGSGIISVYGSKDLVVVRNHTYSAGSASVYFGHIPKRFYPTPLGTLVNNESSGDGVVIELDNVNDFKIGNYYQIFGAAGEGRDEVLITAVNTGGLTVTVYNLPRNYNSGSKIGATPSTFGFSNTGANVFNTTCNRNYTGGTGTCDANSTDGLSYPFDILYYGEPGSNSNLYLLSVVQWGSNLRGYIGFCNENIFYPPLNNDGYIYGIKTGSNEYGTATSGGSNTLTDSSKSWTTNAWANYIVVIADGTGVGQTRKIASNNATTLTLVNNWGTNPSTDSVYYIVEEAYRILTLDAMGYRLAAKEIL